MRKYALSCLLAISALLAACTPSRSDGPASASAQASSIRARPTPVPSASEEPASTGDLYGAIAYGEGRSGYSTRKTTQVAASAVAKNYCHSPACKVVAEFHDECAALAAGGGKEFVGKALAPKDAEKHALDECDHGGKSCKVVTWACSKVGSTGQPARDEWDLVHERIMIPAEGGTTLVAEVVRPPGAGPFPLLVLNHGSPRDVSARPKMSPEAFEPQASRFAVGGWATVSPLRRGYGASTGGWAEAYGTCEGADYAKAGLAGASDIASAIRHMQKLPYVEKDKVVVAGHSAGGFGSIAVGSLHLPGVVAILNFAGGRGSQATDTVCAKPHLIDAMKGFAHGAKVPTLWVYAENDHFFGPALADEMVAAYKEGGGEATLVKAASFGDEGHYLFSSEEGIPIWTPIVNGFLEKQHLPKAR